MTDMDRAPVIQADREAAAIFNAHVTGGCLRATEQAELEEHFAKHRLAFAAERPGVGEDANLAYRLTQHANNAEDHGYDYLFVRDLLKAAELLSPVLPEIHARNPTAAPTMATDEPSLAPPPSASVEGATPELVETIREWLMSTDYEVSDWELQFASAIKAMMTASGWSPPSAPPIPATCGGVIEALRLARPIVEADLHNAIDHADADWDGMSRTALEAIDAALSPTPVAGGE